MVAMRNGYQMVDLHCHILPGLDDGPKTIEESIAMAESAIAEGVTRIAATPHSSRRYFFDFHLDPENLKSLRQDSSIYCINQNSYLLVEFNEISIPPAMDQTLHGIQLAGMRPIVTHPERNRILRAHPERLKKWVRQGCFIQVTGGALTGGFGPVAQKDALRWIHEGLVHFVASDAHNTRSRPLRLQPACDVALDQFGPEKARALFLDNPLAAFEGRDLPHVPELQDEFSPPRKKRFFFF